MKTYILFCLAILTLQTGIAQTKKAPVKKTVTKETNSKSAEEPSPLDVATAGKYAKEFANKMYYTEPLYGDKRQGLNVQIVDWMSKQVNDGSWYYMVKLNLTWQEGTGWGDWKTTSYKGTMIADQFGCNALYLIDEKEEHSVLGIIKRARKLPEDFQQKAAEAKDWTSHAQYYWEPEGCLD